jgi:hypothetical protein
MKNKALLVYGNPNFGEDKDQFREFIETNLRIMSDIAIANGYSPQVIPLPDFDILYKDIKEHQEGDFLFYYTGHANGEILGHYHKGKDIDQVRDCVLKKIANSIKKLPGKKTVILDSCTDNFVPQFNAPKNMKMIGSFEVPFDQGLALSLYDAVVVRKNNLDSLTQETFNEMKHNWVKVKNGEN